MRHIFLCHLFLILLRSPNSNQLSACAENQGEWKEIPGLHAVEDIDFVREKSLTECQVRCIQSASCIAVKYNSKTTRCTIYSEGRDPAVVGKGETLHLRICHRKFTG
ncbi:hypothetical protein PHET_11718 [Paragonimus heterotremus]|uniref:Apple domain-containing protein n=1 Tax=Paragonimus heterotremus TaxID=100268 RepID=A0A8J4SYB1_9TREM|nr:hypothetical protein PHET_11718 [Paragonimus heterotremus]